MPPVFAVLVVVLSVVRLVFVAAAQLRVQCIALASFTDAFRYGNTLAQTRAADLIRLVALVSVAVYLALPAPYDF
jgi:hypothetical protein